MFLDACLRCDSYLEAVLSARDVDSGQVSHVPELGVGVVPQEGQHRDHAIRMDHHLELVVAGHLHTDAHTHTHIQATCIFMKSVFIFKPKDTLKCDTSIWTDLDLLDIFGHHLRHVLSKRCQLIVSDGIFRPDGGCMKENVAKYDSCDVVC